MGIDYYSCDHCGEAFGDYWDGYEMCECGKHYCSQECANDNGFIRYDEEYEGEIPMHKNGKWELESSCVFCRGESVEDEKLLNFALEVLNVSKDELIEDYKKSRM